MARKPTTELLRPLPVVDFDAFDKLREAAGALSRSPMDVWRGRTTENYLTNPRIVLYGTNDQIKYLVDLIREFALLGGARYNEVFMHFVRLEADGTLSPLSPRRFRYAVNRSCHPQLQALEVVLKAKQQVS